jgi:hypothetical protein
MAGYKMGLFSTETQKQAATTNSKPAFKSMLDSGTAVIVTANPAHDQKRMYLLKNQHTFRLV